MKDYKTSIFARLKAKTRRLKKKGIKFTHVSLSRVYHTNAELAP